MFSMLSRQARLTTVIAAVAATVAEAALLAALAEPAIPTVRLERVVVHASSLTAGPYKPAIIRLRFDSTILGGRTAGTVKVYRQATTSSPYRYVKACSASNLPPTGEKSCVDRDASAAASSGLGGDVVMLIRTSTTSRWVGR